MADEKYIVLDDHGLQTLVENMFRPVKDAINGKACFFGECTADGATVAKTATVDNGFTFAKGVQVVLKMKNANTAASPTLSINGSEAKYIKRYGTTAPGNSAAGSWNAGSVVMFIYDGTYWQMLGWINTTYSAVTTTKNGLMLYTDKVFLDDLALTQAQFATLDALLDEDNT